VPGTTRTLADRESPVAGTSGSKEMDSTILSGAEDSSPGPREAEDADVDPEGASPVRAGLFRPGAWASPGERASKVSSFGPGGETASCLEQEQARPVRQRAKATRPRGLAKPRTAFGPSNVEDRFLAMGFPFQSPNTQSKMENLVAPGFTTSGLLDSEVMRTWSPMSDLVAVMVKLSALASATLMAYP